MPSSVKTVAIRQNPELLGIEILPRQFRTFGKIILARIFSSKFSFRLHKVWIFLLCFVEQINCTRHDLTILHIDDIGVIAAFVFPR